MQFSLQFITIKEGTHGHSSPGTPPSTRRWPWCRRRGGAGRRCRWSGWTWSAGWSPPATPWQQGYSTWKYLETTPSSAFTDWFGQNIVYLDVKIETPPGRDGVLVQPEADPGDDDEHAAGHVDRDQVVGELPLEDQLHLEAAVLACNSRDEVVIYTTGRIIMSCRHCHSSLGVLFPGGGQRGMNVNKWMMETWL